MLRSGLALLVFATGTACATDSPIGAPSRETLPNGTVLVRYPALPAIDSIGPEITEAHVDLRIGTVDGDDPNYIFGDIRGVQGASDGTIYVLDYQAVEVRAYSPEGLYLSTIVRSGEGPGEMSEANGIFLSGDTLLWINDHRQWAIIGVDPAGEELRRFTKPIPTYGYIWDGAFDRRGRYWRQTEHSDEEEYAEPGPGLLSEPYRRYHKSYELASGVVDSVYLGEQVYQSHVVEVADGGTWYLNIPFEASDITIADPAGGFWHAHAASYRLTRTAESGDTVVVIEAALAALPVTSEDRSEYIQRTVDMDPGLQRGAEEVADLMPDVKPVVEGLFLDDEDRLWVQRAVPSGTPPFYDLFSRAGDYLGSVRLGFEPRPFSKVSVQHGNLYTWVVDELDTPFVVRAPVS